MKFMRSILLLVVTVFALIKGKPISKEKDKGDVPQTSSSKEGADGAGLWIVDEEGNDDDSSESTSSCDSASGDCGDPPTGEDEPWDPRGSEIRGDAGAGGESAEPKGAIQEVATEDGSAVEEQTSQASSKDVEEDAGKRAAAVIGTKRDDDPDKEHEHDHFDCGHEHEHCCHDGCHHCNEHHHGEEEGHHCHDCEHGYEKFEEWGDECGDQNADCGCHGGCHEHCHGHDDHGHHEDCHGHHCCGHCKEEGDDDDH